MIPRNSETGTAIIAVTLAKNRVFQRRGAIRSMTSLDLSVPEAFRPENEVPKSPCIAPTTHLKYLMWGGSSNPNSRLKAATVSSVAACPKIACPKSPGSISIAEKIIMETIKRVASPKPSRPRTVFKTGCKMYYLILKINMGPMLGPINLVNI